MKEERLKLISTLEIFNFLDINYIVGWNQQIILNLVSRNSTSTYVRLHLISNLGDFLLFSVD